jgi:ribulose-phosphate 3-epimerase
MVLLAASLASAPLGNLEKVIRSLENGSIDLIHFDIEDGIFTPMLTLGTRLIEETRKLTSLPIDVHLAIQNPETIISDIIKMGINALSVHLEACAYPHRTLRMIRGHGVKAGLALNPLTPLPDIVYLTDTLDFVNILTTEPEYPNADFLVDVLKKIEQGRRRYEHLEWEVDGGISPVTIRQAVGAGARIIVAGRSIFFKNSVEANIQALRDAL